LQRLQNPRWFVFFFSSCIACPLFDLLFASFFSLIYLFWYALLSDLAVCMACAEIAQSLCNELDQRFPSQELLDAFGIIYPQY
jgi:hypothetical protein